MLYLRDMQLLLQLLFLLPGGSDLARSGAKDEDRRFGPLQRMWHLRQGLSQRRRPNERARIKTNAKLAIISTTKESNPQGLPRFARNDISRMSHYLSRSL